MRLPMKPSVAVVNEGLKVEDITFFDTAFSTTTITITGLTIGKKYLIATVLGATNANSSYATLSSPTGVTDFTQVDLGVSGSSVSSYRGYGHYSMYSFKATATTATFYVGWSYAAKRTAVIPLAD